MHVTRGSPLVTYMSSSRQPEARAVEWDFGDWKLGQDRQGMPSCLSRILFHRPTLSSQYWDLRSPTPASTVTLPERCYTLDVMYPLMVVGTAERHIQIYNLTNPTTPFKVLSPTPPFLLYFLYAKRAGRLCNLHSNGRQELCLVFLRETALQSAA